MIDEELEEIELSQLEDSPLHRVSVEGYRFRFGSLRSADARDRDSGGQDFVAVRFSRRRLVFAVCDGVAGSFQGDLAALFLGRTLLDWFTDTEALGQADVEARLGEHLDRITATATRQVQAVSIPADTAPAIATVLQAKRDKGSEAMFVAGRVDMPLDGRPGAAALAWMGDMRLRVFQGGADLRLSPRDETSTRQRWSTRRGPVEGRPSAWVGPVGAQEPFRLMAYSDGLKPLDTTSAPLEDEPLRSLMASWRDGPETDDMSLLELWREGPPESAPRVQARSWNQPRLTFG